MNNIYDYYLIQGDKVALIEETPISRIIDEKIEHLNLPHTITRHPIYSIDIQIPTKTLNRSLDLKIGKYHLVMEKIHKTGGEAVIYQGKLDQTPVMIKTYIKQPRRLRAISPILRKFLPQKYLSRAYFVVMEELQDLVYSSKILVQALEFLEISNQPHGDISPGNLMQDSEGNLRVIDFARKNSQGTPFYNKGKTDRQAMARSLIAHRYNISLYQLSKNHWKEKEFFEWFEKEYPQDEESRFLIKMAVN